MSLEALERAVDLAGGQTALATVLGVAQGRVWNWLNRDQRVPAEMVIPIEAATDGKVSRHDLRPDIYPRETTTDSPALAKTGTE